uniref:DNA ligase (NAD(+)) n=1 Tax=Megaviridae environmental sample TaxID=1737588 RepID=A0A5J6VL23_9VIRU|nr:MAG: NAD-dependent DNA ligase adenylation domain protein [Megaviridae environmental sample]
MINGIVTRLRQANQAYHSGISIMEDHEYDQLEEQLRELAPDHPFLKEIGSVPTDRHPKIELPIFLGSMDKIKNDEKKIKRFIKKYSPTTYVISHKLDGLSALYTGSHLYTRGNGYIGSDISHLIRHLRLPKLPKNHMVRGELIIKKNKYEEIGGDTRTARNFVSGIINSYKKRYSKKIMMGIDFVVFQVIRWDNDNTPLNSQKLTPLEQFEIAKNLKFIHVKYKTVERNNINNNTLEEILSQEKKSSEYEIDGIIVTPNRGYAIPKEGNPPWAFAFKQDTNDMIKETTVTDITWKLTKDNRLFPTIHFKEINLMKTRVKKCTGKNAKFILDKGIGVGAVIQVVRSGDVIPNVYKVVTPVTPTMPDGNWDATRTHLMRDGDNTVRTMVHFCKKTNIKQLSEKLVERLVDANINTIKKLINATPSDLIKVEGFKQRMAEKIYAEIQDKIHKLTLLKAMAASNVFGSGIGERKLKAILKEYPRMLEGITVEEIIAIPTMNVVTAQRIIDGIPLFIDWLDETDLILQHENYEEKPLSDVNSAFAGKNIVFTGVRDAELETLISSIGKVTTSISKNTNYVITNDVNGNSSKLKKAREFGIPIVLLDVAREMHNMR